MKFYNEMNFALFIRHILFIVIITISFNSVGQTFSNNLEDSTYNPIWIGTYTIDSGYAHSGEYYSLTDSLQPYGLGLEMLFPEEKRGHNTIMKVEGWVKSDAKNTHSLYVITVERNGETVFWKGIPLSTVLLEEEKWYRFFDSIILPGNITQSGKIKAFLWNAGRRKKVAVDDLTFNFSLAKKKSYLPEIDSLSSQSSIINSKHLFSNTYYTIYYDELNSRILINDNKLNQMINNISYLVKARLDLPSKEEIYNFDYLGLREKKGKYELSFSLKTKYNKIDLKVIGSRDSHKLDFVVNEKYTSNIEISRSTILVDANAQASELYRFNRQTQTNNFQSEYWLDKQGLKIGDSIGSFVIYHCPELSSLQYDHKNSNILLNLDWEKDHPFFRYPLEPDSLNWMLEESFSNYKRGEKNLYHFSAYAGKTISNMPVFMKNPNGFEASYIWTEHADYTDIRTNRATYFGSEKIINADSAIGGFVKYNIPVTKSVFYDNPDSITNTKQSNGIINSLENSIKMDISFSEFLDEIHRKGSEICLHTPEQYTTTPERLEEALKYMQMRYGSPSWIDHGHNNQIHNNREDLICDGSLKDSEFYSMDLWHKYGVKYLHNAYYEENFTFMNSGYNSSIEKAYTGWGDHIPKPDYWQHISRTSTVYHWPTASALFVDKNDMWDYLFNDFKFKDFLSNFSVEMNHCYPAWVDMKKGFWTYDADSTIIAQAGFNNTLRQMAQLRDEGRLNIPTIEEFIDYQLAVENVKYILMNDGRIKVTNTNKEPIKGLSFSTKAKYILVDRLKPSQKTVNGDIIFWFDLKVGESKIIRIIN